MRDIRTGIGMLVVGLGAGWGVLALGVPPAHAAIPRPPSPAWVIEKAEYTGAIVDQIARVRAVFTVDVARDGWQEVPLPLGGATITRASLAKKIGEARLVPLDNGQYSLGVSRKGTYKVTVDFAIRLARDTQCEGLAFGIPRAATSTLSLTVPRKDVELRDSEQLYVERRPDPNAERVVLTATLAPADRIDIRWLTAPVSPAKVEPMVYGEIHTLAVLEDQLMRLTSMVRCRVTQGEVRELAISLPKRYQVLSVNGLAIEEWRVDEQADAPTLRVRLGVALKDTTYALVIGGEQTFAADQAEAALPELTLVGAKQERGQLAVASAGSLEIEPGTLTGLTRIDVKELADTIKTSAGYPIILGLRYHQHPYQATIRVTRHSDLPVLNAIAEQGELVTIVAPQGELLTRAAYAVRANKRQFLGVALPSGATLWSCLVDGRSVKPAEGEGQLLVPLATMNAPEQAILVELVYFEQRPSLARVGTMTLGGPRLDVPTTVVNWRVYAPKEMHWLRTAGNLEPGESAVEFVDEPLGGTLASKTPEWRTVRRTGFFGTATRVAHSQPVEERVRAEASYEPSYAALSVTMNKTEADAATADREQGFLSDFKPADGRGLRDDEVGEVARRMMATTQESGIFPLKIRLPKAGRVHTFTRLMTAQEPLELRATFVRF